MAWFIVFLAVFSTSEEQPLLRIGCVQDVRHLMTQNKSNERIQQIGCVIMQLMSADEVFISDASVSMQIIQIVSDAMSRLV